MADGASIDIRLLGPVAAFHGRRRVPLGPRRQRLVLAVLALEANQAVPVDRMVDLAWPDRAPRTATHAIQVCVSRLRATLSATGVPPQHARIDRAGAAYALRVDPAAVDAHRFRDLVRQAAQGDDRTRVATLTDALGLWSGPPLSDAAEPDVQQRLCRGLEEARLAAVEERVDARLRLGRNDEVLAELAGMVEASPTRERLVCQYMTALYRTGRAGDALAVSRDVRRRLAEELGIDPGPALCRLEMEILRNDPPPATAVDVPPPAPTAPAAPRQLPPDVRPFTGREAELAELDRCRDAADATGEAMVAAVCGTGGVGKTALAVHWAHRVADRFPDGQLYLDLRGFGPGAPLTVTQALDSVLGALGATPDAAAGAVEPSARLRSELAGRRVLLVLDNAAGAEQVRPLLPGDGPCAVLVTSRDLLSGLVARDGVRRVRLDPLPVDRAVGLLRDLAGEAVVAAAPDAAVEVAERCARLPLALRIAADLLTVPSATPVADLAAALARDGDTLDLLDAGADEQTAVRTVISWSERRLSDRQATLLWLIGAHPGRDLDDVAAAALAGTEVRQARQDLAALGRASLLTATGAARWSMHDLLRAYTAERRADRLPADAEHRALTRLFDHYLAHAATATDVLYPARKRRGGPAAVHPGADLDQARRWLNTERLNLVACAAHAADHGWPEHAVRFATTVEVHLDVGYYNSEALLMHHRALAAAQDCGDRGAAAGLHRALASTYTRAGRYPLALHHYRQALDGYRDQGNRAGAAAALHGQSLVHMSIGDYTTAKTGYHEALAAFRDLGDRYGEGRILGNLGRIEAWQGHLGSAMDCYRRAGAIFDEIGDRTAYGRNLSNIGLLLERSGRLDDARDLFRRAGAIAGAVGDRAAQACATADLGRIHHRRGDQRQAADHLDRALDTFREIGDQVGEIEVRIDLGRVLAVTAGPSAALAEHRRAYRVACQVGEPRLQADALVAFADVLAAAGRRASAEACWRRALDLYTGLSSGEAAAVRERLAAPVAEPAVR